MHFFNTGIFWFIEGIFLCIIIIGLKLWTDDRHIPMPFWKWILLVIWILLFSFTIAFITTSIGENELTAAVKGGIIFGLFSIITGVGLWRLLSVKTDVRES